MISASVAPSPCAQQGDSAAEGGEREPQCWNCWNMPWGIRLFCATHPAIRRQYLEISWLRTVFLTRSRSDTRRGSSLAFTRLPPPLKSYGRLSSMRRRHQRAVAFRLFMLMLGRQVHRAQCWLRRCRVTRKTIVSSLVPVPRTLASCTFHLQARKFIDSDPPSVGRSRD